MRVLENVTLAVVATQNWEAALAALDYSQKGIKFGDVLFVSNRNPIGEGLKYRYVNIQPFKSVSEWGRFVVFDLHKYIDTKFILLIHEDGFVVNPQAWDDDWFNYDYVGAPFPYPKDKFSFRDQSGVIIRVGNSVSLRSKKLLELPEKIGLRWENFDGGFPHEDGYLCVQHRYALEKKGVKYAPFEVALRFGREVNLPEHRGIHPFTFHKWAGPNRIYPCFNPTAVRRKKIRRIVNKIKGYMRIW